MSKNAAAAAKSMDELLESFKPNRTATPPGEYNRRSVTFWLEPEEKELYDKLQELSRGTEQRFSEVARAGLIALMHAAWARIGATSP